MISKTSTELLTRFHNFFYFNVRARASLDEIKNMTIKVVTSSSPLLLDSRPRNLLSSDKKNLSSFSSFVSWLCGPKRQKMPFLQHFNVQLGLVQVVERFLGPQEEIDASAWYVREILVSWHRLVGLSHQLLNATQEFFKDSFLVQLSQGIVNITMNGLFSGTEDSSIIPLCQIPGGMLFRLTGGWIDSQNHYLSLLDEALFIYHELLDRQVNKKVDFQSSVLINDDELLSIPLLHHLHFLIPSRSSIIRRRLLGRRMAEDVVIPSTIPRSDAWGPPPLLKNSRGRWSDLGYVLVHLMRWELMRIKKMLSKLDHVDSSTWHVNWSSLQFPPTRTMIPGWSSEGAFLLHVGLLPNRYFQFVQPILPHYHVLVSLLNGMLKSDLSRLNVVKSVVKVLFPGSTVDFVNT